MTKLKGKAKARARAKKRLQQEVKPTFKEMIHFVADDTSGNTKANMLATRMISQMFVIPGRAIWTDTQVTEDGHGVKISPEQYWNFIEWYNGQGGEENRITGGDAKMPYVPIRDNLTLYNHIKTHNLLDKDTDGWKIQELMLKSMNHWLDELCHNDPKWPLLQYTVMINEKLLGTEKHNQGVHQGTVFNIGPLRVVMVEGTINGTEVTLKDNPDWEDYCGKNNIKQ